MTEQNSNPTTSEEQAAAEPKKISLAEAVKQKLAQKKAEQANGGKQQKGFHDSGTQAMKSQNHKKVNNQRKKMGV